jgi:hypothetical protein
LLPKKTISAVASRQPDVPAARHAGACQVPARSQLQHRQFGKNHIGEVLKKLETMGQLDNTIVAFTTDNGAEVITYPDGGTTPVKGGKLTTWEGGMRAPAVVRRRATTSARSSRR